MVRTHHTPASIASAAASLCLALAAAAQGPFDGTFASGRLAMELHQSGDQLTGTVTVNSSACPLTGSIHDDRATAEFDLSGQKFPLEAGLEGPVLVVTSAGITHRLVRQVIEGNPLADASLSQPAPSEAPAGDSRLPQVLTLASGATIRYPDGWMTQPLGRLATLIPTPAPGQLLPQAMYGVLTVPWPTNLGLATSEGAQRLTTVVGQLLPGLSREGEPELLGASEAEGVLLRFAAPSLTGLPSKIHLLARGQGDSAALVLGMGDESSLQFDAPTLKDMLATVQAPPPPADPAPADATGQVLATPVAPELPTAGPAAAEPVPQATPAAPPQPSAQASPAPQVAAPPAAAPVASDPPPQPAPPVSSQTAPAAPPAPATAAPPAAAAPPPPAPAAPPPAVSAPVKQTPPAPAPLPAAQPGVIPHPFPVVRPALPVAPLKAGLDPAVIGTWRSTESHVSGAAALAIQVVYRFNADGTFTLGSRSAGGDARTSLESGLKITTTGTWSAANGVLKTTNQKGQASQINYLFHNGQLVFKRGPGKYTFWSR